MNQLLRALDDPRAARATGTSRPTPPCRPPIRGTRAWPVGFGALVVRRAALSEPEWARADATLRQALGPPSEAAHGAPAGG